MTKFTLMKGKNLLLLTKLDQSRLLINPDNIKYIERTPDTIITFMNGDRLVVLESLDEVRQAVIQLRSDVIRYSQNNTPEL